MSEIADLCRSEGNKHYCERNFYDALVKYNESLCFAIVGSEAMGLAYANRSAVYFEMKMFKKCLSNIQLARKNGYPENKFNILDSREFKCLEEIKNGNEISTFDNAKEFLKLSHDPNPKLPFVADCLELKKSKNFGRFIVAKKDLKVGEILAIEKPHFKILKSDQRYENCSKLNMYQRCANCLKDNLMDLIPCPSCSSTMYCSTSCMEYAEENFHNFECEIIELLHKCGVMQMTMRVFFQALNIFEGSIEKMENFLSKFDKLSTSVYDFDFSATDENTKARNFLVSLYCLARNDKNASSNSSPRNIFIQHPLLLEMWDEYQIFIEKFFKRILSIGDSNFHGICGWSIQKHHNNDPQMIGIGCYPFISLVNHSCYPNVTRQYYKGKMMLVVERPIKKGEQLFDCYKTTFFTVPKIQRQLILFEEYSFRCECEACNKNFPLFNSLKSVDKKLLKFAKKEKLEISKSDAETAIKKFSVICDHLQNQLEINKECPSSEIILLQECLQQCLAIINKPKILFP